MSHGIIAVDKPEGISSARVVAQIKRIFKAKKAGHTGTLDPFATGLLLCAINKGTRISRFFLGGTKQYQAGIHLGIETDTLDRTGQIEYQTDPGLVEKLTRQEIETVISSFKGPQKQIPPVFSALKHQGQPLYRLARKGKKIIKPAREIEVYSITLERIALPLVHINVHASSGTYIRSLARDIGNALGTGGHLSSLRRTCLNSICVDQAVSLETLERMAPVDRVDRVVPMGEALNFMPSFIADLPLIETIRYGRKLPLPGMFSGASGNQEPFIRILDEDGALAAILEFNKSLGQYNYCCVFLD